METERPGRIRDIRAYRPAFVGMVVLACAPFLILGAAPAYGALATVALAVLWVVLFALGCRWFMSRPRRVVVVGVVSVLAWLAVVLVANFTGG